MANSAKGEVPLQVGEKTYTLKLGTNALAELTGMLSIGLNDVNVALTEGRVDVIRAVLWASLRRYHSLDLIQTGDLIDEAGFGPVADAIGKALELAFPPTDPAAGNPQSAA